MDGTGTGIEPVDDRFKLGGKTEIVQRRHQHDHIAVHQLLNQFLFNGILLHAGTVHAAGITPPAGMDIFKSGVETEHFMTFALRAFYKFICQQGRRAGLMRTACNHNDFHPVHPPYKFLPIRKACSGNSLPSIAERLPQPYPSTRPTSCHSMYRTSVL